MADQRRTEHDGCARDVVGVVGLGAMGAAIASRLLDVGFEVWVTNRSPAKGRRLVEAGARWAETPSELAAQVPLAITMVSDDTALEEVMNSGHGILAGARPGLLCADMSTVSPEASARVAAACQGTGVQFMRVPVSGGPGLAETGELGALISGPPEARARLRGLLEALSTTAFYLGEGEQARVMKLALNMLIGATVVGLGEALVLGERWGLDWDHMLDVFSASAVASPFVKYKASLLARRDFPPAFTTLLLAKDLDLALDLAQKTDCEAAVTERTRQVVEQAIAAGLGDADAVSVVVVLEQLARARAEAKR